MNLMKKGKIGLMMGAGLLLVGAGVSVAMTTTSCGNGDKYKKSELNYSGLKIQRNLDEPNVQAFSFIGNLENLPPNLSSVHIFTTTDGSEPTFNDCQN
jgi:hypothetical protein